MSKSTTYRLLASGDGANGIWYVVAVEAPLPSAAIREVVCEVIRREQPVSYRRLNIDIVVGLDSYVAPIGHGDTTIDRKQLEHWIGNYVWNVELPDKKNRLYLVTEPQFEDFDHLKDCKK